MSGADEWFLVPYRAVVMSCRRSLSWLDGDASQHLFCFLRIVILVYFCSIEFHYITLLELNSIASAAVHLKPASSS